MEQLNLFFYFQEESWATLWPEMSKIWADEHRVETHPPQIVDAAIDILKYQILDTQQKLCITTLRDADKQLGGYHVSILDKHLNMSNYIFAFTTMYFVCKKYRGQGLGKKLFLAAEKNIKKRPEVYAIWSGSKTALASESKLFDELDYKEHEMVRVKWLWEIKKWL